MGSSLKPPSARLRQPELWNNQDIPAAFGSLEELIFESGQKGVIEDLPGSKEEAQSENYAYRARVIGERLWLLGYLSGYRLSARRLFRADRAAFLDAVAAFQAEAGLVADSWVGKKTWSALEELVSFEGLPLGDSWFRGEQLCIAFQRAVQCRLFALGLVRHRPAKTFEGIEESGRARLERILVSLRVFESDDLTEEKLYRCLLDQDQIAAAIADLAVNDPSGSASNDQLVFRYYVRPSWHRRKHQRLMRKFILQVAKVELWLLGFDISIDGKDNFPVRHFPHASGRKNKKVQTVLSQFYRDLVELSQTQADTLSEEITPEFFRAIVLQEHLRKDDVPVNVEDGTDVQLLLDEFKSQAEIDAALVEGRELGMRIWDGIKRVFRWFRNLYRRVVRIGKNLVRGFYRYATKGVQIVRRSLRAFTESAYTYIHSEWRDAQEDWPLVQFHRDLDVLVYQGPNTSAEDCRRVGLRLSLFSLRFRFSAKAIGLVFEALVAGVLNHWARLARALVENFKELLPLYRQLQETETQLA